MEKKTLCAAEQHREDVVEQRQDWKMIQELFDWENFVFLDETWTKTNMSPLCGKILHGNGLDFTKWLDRMRLVLLSEGFEGMDRELSSLSSSGDLSPGRCVAVKSLHKYLGNNRERLPYRERLAAGLAIGTGQVEGACKNLVGRRLKQTGACWRVERANRLAVICALLYSKQWKPYWENSP